jgi:hypothetical protein
VLLLQREAILLLQGMDRLSVQLVRAAPIGIVHPEDVQKR